ncbi:MAG: hypothetical protein ACTSYC_03970 [Promethearchaeota archaeon]
METHRCCGELNAYDNNQPIIEMMMISMIKAANPYQKLAYLTVDVFLSIMSS